MTSSFSKNIDYPETQHPELVDEQLLETVLLKDLPAEGTHKTSINILEICGKLITWYENVDDDELDSLLSFPVSHFQKDPLVNQEDRKALRFVFIQNVSNAEAYWLRTVMLQPSTMRILKKGGLSGPLLCEIASPDVNWDKMGDTRFMQRNADKSLASFEISYRYQCGWGSQIGTSPLVSFTQFTRTRNLSTYFCINYPPRAFQRLKRHAAEFPLLLSREFFVDALAADECMRAWQLTIGTTRETLMRFVSHFSRTPKNVQIDTVGQELQIDDRYIDSDTKALHRLSKQWHMLSQDISDLSAQLQFLQASYVQYMKVLGNPGDDWPLDRTADTNESFEALESRCNVYGRWVTNYRDRTNIRIGLLFHLSNQREARTQREIATSTALVAEQTQRDSSSMITIAAVTMLFLPGTFVSAILSTTFFQYGSDGLAVSSKWWILPVATLPLMIVVFAVWLGWQKWLMRKNQAEAVMRERMAQRAHPFMSPADVRNRYLDVETAQARSDKVAR